MNKETIKQYIEANFSEAHDLWEKMVQMGGCCFDSISMNELANFLKAEFEKLDMECQLIEVSGGMPPVLVGITKNGNPDSKPVLFSGHYDTVFPFADYKTPAFTEDSGIARGPGVLDMKGGIAVSWLVIKVLQELKCDLPPLKIVFCGDEESDRIGSNTDEILTKHVTDCRFAFNMETGLMDRSICIGRKGCHSLLVKVNGVSSHPGNFFQRGRNAIEEAANKIIALQKLTPEDLSYTVSVDTITGGTFSNVIPDKCEFQIDIRYHKVKDLQNIKNEIGKICAMQFVPDTSTEIITMGDLKPFETQEKEEALYNYLTAVAAKYDIPQPGKVILGGASDAATICRTNTPVLCSMGVSGENNHSINEYADVSSFIPRAELLTYTILDYKDFEI